MEQEFPEKYPPKMNRRTRRIHHKERILKNRFSSIKNSLWINGVYQFPIVSEPHYKYGVHINTNFSYSCISYFYQSCKFAKFFSDGLKSYSYGHRNPRHYYLPRKISWSEPSNMLSKIKNRKNSYSYHLNKKQKIKYEKADLSFREQMLDLQ